MEGIPPLPPHSLPPRPKYPLGQPPKLPRSYARRLISSWRDPSVNRPSIVKSKTGQDDETTVSEKTSESAINLIEDEHDPSVEVAGVSTHKRSRKEDMTGVENMKVTSRAPRNDMEYLEEEGTRVICGSMEDDTPIKKRKLPIKHTPHSSPTPSSQHDGLSVTVETTGTSVRPSVHSYPPPTPQTTPFITQIPHDSTVHTVAHTAALLAFLSEPDDQGAISLLPSTLSPAHRQSLIDLKGRMSMVDDERSFLSTKVSHLEEKLDVRSRELRDHQIIHAGVESELKMTKEKYRKLKVMYEQKEETVCSLKKSIEDTRDRHATDIERKVKELEINHTLNLASRVLEIEAQKEEESRYKLKELSEKHESDMKGKLKAVDVQHKLDIAMIKSNCTAQVKDWKDQAESLIQERNQLRVDSMVQKREGEAVNRKLDESRKDIASITEARRESELRNQANQLEIDSLIFQVVELGSAVASKEGEVHCLETENDVLEKLMKEKGWEVDKLTGRISTNEALLITLRQQKDKLVTHLKLLSVEKVALEVSKSNLEAKIVELESKEKEQNEKLSKIQEELGIYISKSRRYEQLEKDFEILAKDMELLDKEYKHCQTDNQQTKSRFASLTSQIQSLQSDLLQRDSNFEDLNKQFQLSHLSVSTAENGMEKWKKEAEDYQRDNLDLQRKIARLERQQSELSITDTPRGPKRSSVELESVRKEKLVLQEQLEELQSEREWFYDEINGYKTTIATTQTDLTQSEDRNRELEAELAKLKSSYTHLEVDLRTTEMKLQESENQCHQDLADNDALNKTILELQDHTQTLREKVKTLEKCKVDLGEKERELQSRSKRHLTVQLPSTALFEKRLANSEHRVTNLQLEISRKDDEIEKLKNLKKNLEGRCNNLNHSNKDRDRRLSLCKAKIKELERSIGEKEGVIVNITQEVEVLRGVRLELEERVKEKEETIRMLNQKLVEFQSDLDRYISAYHLPRQDLSNPKHVSRTVTQLRTRHEQSTSFRSRIMERVANRANHLQDLMTDHRSMKNERSYSVSKREYEHCSYLLNLLKDLDDSERQLGKLIDEMKA
ncbi:hypothetical protein V865_004269 [Kwoniella europaea PYCC6329]|uniref:Uncharacterized protein n=1 Tax=Kwoniella europaea PYCC6329 TaxID=1423913 RepID=A0AAX4KJ44_9TREE